MRELDRSKAWRQFAALQRAVFFGTFSDVRTIAALLTLLGSVWTISAQEQERKLVDRILKPNLALTNPAQDKPFSATRLSIDKQAPSTRFYTRAKPFAKPFAGQRGLTPREFPARQFRAGNSSANISTRSQVAKAETPSSAPAVYITHVAPESAPSLAPATFAGNRPFLSQGKSQKALSAHDTPLTLEQVRELLNKNK